MKKLTKSGFALALAFVFLATSLSAFAATGGEDDLITIKSTSNVKYELNRVTNSDKVRMGIKLMEEQKIRLLIVDEDNEMVFAKRYRSTEGFMQLFDFSNLNDGTYTFKIKAGDENLENEVIISHSKPLLPEFSAYISDVEDKKVKFSYFAPEHDVYLLLKNSDGEVLFEKKVGAGYNSSGIANLSKLEKGVYTLEIRNGIKVESKDIEI